MTKATTTKKDEMKKEIMNFLNEQSASVPRKEISEKVGNLGSERTISRALAELKLNGQVIQQKEGNAHSWLSLELAPTEEPVVEETVEETVEEKPVEETVEEKPVEETVEEKPVVEETVEEPVEEPEKNGIIITRQDIESFDPDWISVLVDKELKARNLKPTKSNIADVKKEVETVTFMKKVAQNSPETWSKRMKIITKESLINVAKVKRNSSTNSTGKSNKGKSASKKAASKKSTSKKSASKAPGVIATIINLISVKPMTKKQIQEKLQKSFPDRDADKMMKTINVQVPSRLRKDKGLIIEKTDKGYQIITKK